MDAAEELESMKNFVFPASPSVAAGISKSKRNSQPFLQQPIFAAATNDIQWHSPVSLPRPFTSSSSAAAMHANQVMHYPSQQVAPQRFPLQQPSVAAVMTEPALYYPSVSSAGSANRVLVSIHSSRASNSQSFAIRSENEGDNSGNFRPCRSQRSSPTDGSQMGSIRWPANASFHQQPQQQVGGRYTRSAMASRPQPIARPGVPQLYGPNGTLMLAGPTANAKHRVYPPVVQPLSSNGVLRHVQLANQMTTLAATGAGEVSSYGNHCGTCPEDELVANRYRPAVTRAPAMPGFVANGTQCAGNRSFRRSSGHSGVPALANVSHAGPMNNMANASSLMWMGGGSGYGSGYFRTASVLRGSYSMRHGSTSSSNDVGDNNGAGGAASGGSYNRSMVGYDDRAPLFRGGVSSFYDSGENASRGRSEETTANGAGGYEVDQLTAEMDTPIVFPPQRPPRNVHSGYRQRPPGASQGSKMHHVSGSTSSNVGGTTDARRVFRGGREGTSNNLGLEGAPNRKNGKTGNTSTRSDAAVVAGTALPREFSPNGSSGSNDSSDGSYSSPLRGAWSMRADSGCHQMTIAKRRRFNVRPLCIYAITDDAG